MFNFKFGAKVALLIEMAKQKWLHSYFRIENGVIVPNRNANISPLEMNCIKYFQSLLENSCFDSLKWKFEPTEVFFRRVDSSGQLLVSVITDDVWYNLNYCKNHEKAFK